MDLLQINRVYQRFCVEHVCGVEAQALGGGGGGCANTCNIVFLSYVVSCCGNMLIVCGVDPKILGMGLLNGKFLFYRIFPRPLQDMDQEVRLIRDDSCYGEYVNYLLGRYYISTGGAVMWGGS